MEAFKPDNAIANYQKIQTFLEEVCKGSGQRLEVEECKVSCLVRYSFFSVKLCSRQTIGQTLCLVLINVCEVLNAPEDGKVINRKVPVSSIKIQLPPDGLPSITDWLTTAGSFIFSGSRLYREPLDLNLPTINDFKPDVPCFEIKKGFARLMLNQT